MKTLKIHLSTGYDEAKKEGKTECGEPFFKSHSLWQGPGYYQAVRRIGGLRAVEVSEFDDLMFDEHVCVRCRNKYWNR